MKTNFKKVAWKKDWSLKNGVLKLKIEKKFSEFFRIFLKFPLSRIVPKNVNKGPFRIL